MHIRQRTRQRIATGLMILFLALALVPIYQILAKMSPGGRFVQLCSAMGIQTVWVADEPSVGDFVVNPSSNAPDGVTKTQLSKMSMSPFGSCEFCWTSALAMVLPLAIMLFFGLPQARFFLPIYQAQAFQSFLRQWHASPRAPPTFSLI